jgi:hypothetical protein
MSANECRFDPMWAVAAGVLGFHRNVLCFDCGPVSDGRIGYSFSRGIGDFFFRVGAAEGFMMLLNGFRGAETRFGRGPRTPAICTSRLAMRLGRS